MLERGIHRPKIQTDFVRDDGVEGVIVAGESRRKSSAHREERFQPQTREAGKTQWASYIGTGERDDRMHASEAFARSANEGFVHSGP
jgi:hypothetical protein